MQHKAFVRHGIVAALVVFTLASSRPAFAQTPPDPQYQCMTQLGNCYYWAAAQPGFWTMWAAGIDCELQVVACIRRALMGR